MIRFDNLPMPPSPEEIAQVALRSAREAVNTADRITNDISGGIDQTVNVILDAHREQAAPRLNCDPSLEAVQTLASMLHAAEAAIPLPQPVKDAFENGALHIIRTVGNVNRSIEETVGQPIHMAQEQIDAFEDAAKRGVHNQSRHVAAAALDQLIAFEDAARTHGGETADHLPGLRPETREFLKGLLGLPHEIRRIPQQTMQNIKEQMEAAEKTRNGMEEFARRAAELGRRLPQVPPWGP